MTKVIKDCESLGIICTSSDVSVMVKYLYDIKKRTMLVAINRQLAELVNKAGYECTVFFDCLPTGS